MRYSHRVFLQSLFAVCLLRPVYGDLEDCTFKGKDINLDNGASTVGITGTVICKDRETGKLAQEIPYVNGKENGILKDYRWGTKKFIEYKDDQPTHRSQEWDEHGRLVVNTLSPAKEQHAADRAYYPNGKIMSETLTQPGSSATLHLEYYADGHLAEMTCDAGAVGRKNCRYGDKTTELKTYYKNGKLKDVLRFSHGLRDGISEIHFDTNGKIGRKETWVAGVQEGLSEDFWDNGHVMTQKTFKNGKETGSLKKYFEDGALAEESVTLNGEIQKEITYYQNGHKKAETTRRGNEIVAAEYWDNGKPEFTGTFTEKTAYGMTGEIIVDEALTPLSDGTITYNPWGGDVVAWKDLLEQGVHQHYFEQGPVEDETTYKDGKRDGMSRSYYPNKKMAVDAVYKDDNLVSKKEYDKKGKLTSNESYYPDGSRKTAS